MELTLCDFSAENRQQRSTTSKIWKCFWGISRFWSLAGFALKVCNEIFREENPDFNLYSEAVKAQIWKDTKNGPFIMNYSPTKGAGFSVCGWRGDKSLRLYINKHDRIHFLHLMGESLPDWLKVRIAEAGNLSTFSILNRGTLTTWQS